MKKINLFLVFGFVFLFSDLCLNFGMALSKSRIRSVVDKFEKKAGSLKDEAFYMPGRSTAFRLKIKSSLFRKNY